MPWNTAPATVSAQPRLSQGLCCPQGPQEHLPQKESGMSLPVMGIRHWLGHTKGKQKMLEEKQIYPNPALASGARSAWE